MSDGDISFDEAARAKGEELAAQLLPVWQTFRHAIKTMAATFQAFWEGLKDAYVDAGEPYGPANDPDNVAAWIRGEAAGFDLDKELALIQAEEALGLGGTQ